VLSRIAIVHCQATARGKVHHHAHGIAVTVGSATRPWVRRMELLSTPPRRIKADPSSQHRLRADPSPRYRFRADPTLREVAHLLTDRTTEGRRLAQRGARPPCRARRLRRRGQVNGDPPSASSVRPDQRRRASSGRLGLVRGARLVPPHGDRGCLLGSDSRLINCLITDGAHDGPSRRAQAVSGHRGRRPRGGRPVAASQEAGVQAPDRRGAYPRVNAEGRRDYLALPKNPRPPKSPANCPKTPAGLSSRPRVDLVDQADNTRSRGHRTGRSLDWAQRARREQSVPRPRRIFATCRLVSLSIPAASFRTACSSEISFPGANDPTGSYPPSKDKYPEVVG
jgi:hypothetical protein